MPNSIYLSIIIVCQIITEFTVVNASPECLYNSCFCFDDSINCRARDLTAVPPAQPNSNKLTYKQLSLSNNNINKLGDDSFSGLNLNKVWFRYNNLRTITPNAFRGVIGIHLISFQSNRMHEISSESLEPLSNSLNTLNINMNEFINVPNLSGLEVLETLNLSHNQISTLNDINGRYEPLFPVSLKSLALNVNFFEKIEATWFEDLTNLQTLNLASNKISVIDNDAFVELKNLIILDLHNNSIVHISNEWFKSLDRIETVILSYQQNEIELIENNSFDSENPKSVTAEYYLEGNKIKAIDNRAFCPKKFPPNSNFIVSINKTTFNNINPCMLRQIASYKPNDATIVYNTKTYTLGENIDFNCMSVNYFQRLNLSLILNHQNETSGSTVFYYRNCARRIVTVDVCADFVQFNCFDPIIFVNYTNSSGFSEIIQTTGTIRFNTSETISVPCSIAGYNNEVVPEIEWRNQANIKMTDVEDVKNSNRQTLTKYLKIKNATREMGGLYYCTNKNGSPKVEIKIAIQSAPSKPKITGVDIVDRITALKWKIEDLGNLELTDFHLEWYGTRNNLNKYSVKLFGNTDEVFIPFQIPSNATVRMLLENVLGKSEQSEPYFVFGTEKASASAQCMLELHSVFNRCFSIKNEPD